MKLNTLQPDPGSRKPRKRLGAGIGSGHGKTCGRGHKGQKSRSGGKVARGFEGGQMPLIRRVPKRGFTRRGRVPCQVVNVGMLNRFEEGSRVDADLLKAAGLVRSAERPIKLLGEGTLEKRLEVVVTAASKRSAAKVAEAGGSLILQGS
ncbi:MAG: 50S ribosomal protein L15 [Zetaproteobacteria bacterium]|nr:MAG: 50S ribosomal protein L15 [Zetaproteobacteria bacterium]